MTEQDTNINTFPVDETTPPTDQPPAVATGPLAESDVILTGQHPTGPPQPTFTPDAASSHAQDLTAKYPTLTPRSVEPTERNSNHALRVEDQADGWFAEICVDDDAHHAWLVDQIEGHLSLKEVGAASARPS